MLVVLLEGALDHGRSVLDVELGAVNLVGNLGGGLRDNVHFNSFQMCIFS